MTAPITITLKGEAELQRLLARAEIDLGRPGELMRRIGDQLERNIQFRFDAKVAPDGTPWLPLSPKTLAAYAKEDAGKGKRKGKGAGGRRGTLLERTRFMRSSLTSEVSSDGRSVTVGFGDPKALYHELGTRRGLPRRQMLTDDPVAGTLGVDDRQDVLDVVNGYLKEVLGG